MLIVYYDMIYFINGVYLFLYYNMVYFIKYSIFICLLTLIRPFCFLKYSFKIYIELNFKYIFKLLLL